MDFRRNIIITGGAGFIGSHVVRLFVNKYPNYHIINFIFHGKNVKKDNFEKIKVIKLNKNSRMKYLPRVFYYSG